MERVQAVNDSGPTDQEFKPGERPTLKTISRLTGLAVATVSRALNDAPDISEQTKRRVRDMSDRVGYRPNRAGVRLRTGKTNVISLVMSTDQDMMNHTARLITSIVAELHNTPYHMIMTPYFSGRDPMDPVRYIVETGSADAIILNQIEPQDPRVAYLMGRGFPFATHGRTDWAEDHAYFDFDNSAFARLAIKAFVARGRRNVLVVLPPQTQSYSMAIRVGALACAAETGLDITILPDLSSDDPGATIEAVLTPYLAQHPATDAILVSSPAACMAAVAAAENLGRVPGQDIDFSAKEAIPFLKRFRKPILTVYEDVSHAGKFLANATIRRIADPEAAPMQFLDVPENIL